MIYRLPCPIPGCNHSCTGPNRHFSSQPTLLRHLNHDDHQATYHLADQSICMTADIYSCTHHSCPTAPTRFFHSLNKLIQHNTLHHPPPPLHSPSTNDHPPPHNSFDIGTSSSTQKARMGHTTCGTLASPSSSNTPTTTHQTSETHGADTSNTATVRISYAYKRSPFKQSPTHTHSP